MALPQLASHIVLLKVTLLAHLQASALKEKNPSKRAANTANADKENGVMGKAEKKFLILFT